MHLVIYTDGGARGNPGPAGIGVVIYRVKQRHPERLPAQAGSEGSRTNVRDAHTREILRPAQNDKGLELVEKFGRYIGETTNNQAEYQALLAALERAHKLGAEFLECFLDSELVVRQLNREYKVRDANLAPLFVKIWNITIHFKEVHFFHIPREKNKEADQLVNEAIDKSLKSSA